MKRTAQKQSIKQRWTAPSPTPSASPQRFAPRSPGSPPIISAEALHRVAEPLRWRLALRRRSPPAVLTDAILRGAQGAIDDGWTPPSWLLPHQRVAAQRIAGAIGAFGGALLADAVGLGKTFTALAVATRYRRVAVVSPAVIVHQWRPVIDRLTPHVHHVITHESLSRGATVPVVDLIVVDEAHRFRNASTRRYDRLARSVGRAHLLLVTATPAVNGPHDLLNLLRLFLSHPVLAFLGMADGEPAGRGKARAIVRAIAPLVVARSHATAGIETRLPAAEDACIQSAAPIPRDALGDVLTAIDRLAFPLFSSQSVRDLLRHHALHRLASSAEALAATLRRHRRVALRHLESPPSGKELAVPGAAAILEEGDEFQLLLPLGAAGPPAARPTTAAVRAECRRLDDLIGRLGSAGASPKALALQQALRRRGDRKTIVFVTAQVTATALTRALGWKRVVLVTGGSARIASGALPMADALTLFAPAATGGNEPPERARAQTLIATDLVSEGLNLQDADGVVHYDLPWTPLRLQQRLGRILRLGSSHRHVDVLWFIPHPLIERRCNVRGLIDRKADDQAELGVAVRSQVGRAYVVGAALERRERWISQLHTGHRSARGYAVVRGLDASVFVVNWSWEDRHFREIVAFKGAEAAVVEDLATVVGLAERLLQSPPTSTGPARHHRKAVLRHIRRRLRTAMIQPAGEETRRLRRAILRRAAAAAARRHFKSLQALERVLDVLSRGVPEGGTRCLGELVRGRTACGALDRWTAFWDGPAADVPHAELEAGLVGDGTVDS